jgi:hypothetical protein
MKQAIVLECTETCGYIVEIHMSENVPTISRCTKSSAYMCIIHGATTSTMGKKCRLNLLPRRAKNKATSSRTDAGFFFAGKENFHISESTIFTASDSTMFATTGGTCPVQ